MHRLMNGPAAAMKNSAFALGGSSCRFATPPSRNRVMDETRMLNRRATSECESSCATIELKNRSAVITDTRSVFWSDQKGYCDGKTSFHRLKKTSPKMTTHEMWMRSSIPNSRAMRKEPGTHRA